MGKRWQLDRDKVPTSDGARAKASPDSGRPTRWRWRDKGQTKDEGLSRSTINGIVGVFGFVTVVTLIVIIVWWLNPLPPPRLVLLSARCRRPLLPPNPFALNDAAALYAQSETFNTRDADLKPLNLVEMRAIVDDLAEIEPGRLWFLSEKTTAMVYANAVGVGLWDRSGRRSVAYLLPSDFEVPVENQPVENWKAVSVTDVVNKLVACKADHKILVLDCQRNDHIWPLGVLVNDFVDAVLADLRSRDPKQTEGLYVLLSCSPGETSWSDPSQKQSPFGQFFARGITGTADEEGDRDGRVTLRELADFVRGRVSEWARANRATTQTPVLEAFSQDAGAVQLASMGRSSGYQAPTYTEDLAEGRSLRTKLQSEWRDHFEMGLEEPPPNLYAPHDWRYVQDSLLRTERFWSAGDIEAMKIELNNISFRKDAIRKAREAYALTGQAFSLPMQSFIQGTKYVPPEASAVDRPIEPAATAQPAAPADAKTEGAEKVAKAEPAPPPTPRPQPRRELVSDPIAGFTAVIQDAVDGRTEMTAAASQIATGELGQLTPPIEAHLIEMFAQHLAPMFQTRVPPDATRRMQDTVSLRLLAEQSAVPENLYAPDVFRWIRARVDGADAQRRRFEDAVFAELVTPVALGQSVPPADGGRQQYLQAVKDARTVGDAIRLRHRLLTELPFLTALVGQRQWQTVPEELAFRKKVEDATNTLIRRAVEISQILKADPTLLTADDVADRIRRLSSATDEGQTHRRDLLAMLGTEARSLGDSKGPARTQPEWRRIDDLLTIPLPCSARDPDESAFIRLNLLERHQAQVLQGGERSTVGEGSRQTGNYEGVDQQARRDHARRMGSLAAKLYSLGTGEELDVHDGEPAEVGHEVAGLWRRLYQKAVQDPEDLSKYEQVFQVEAARRTLDGYAAELGSYAYVQQLRNLNLAELLAWHAMRFAEDFWAGSKGDQEHYFQLTAGEYLRRAKKIHPLGDVFRRQTERYKVLVDVADKLRLRPSVAQVDFRGKDSVPFKLDLDIVTGYPTGVAALRTYADPNYVEFQPQNVRQLPFDYLAVSRAGEDSLQTLSLGLLFRGHVDRREIPIVVRDPGKGQTVVYEDERGAGATYLVRLAGKDRSDQRLLFLLDLSNSMDAGSPKKIEVERSVLKQFADDTPDDAIDVGAHVFGHRYKMLNADDQENMKLSMKDTESWLKIGPFNRDNFTNRVVSQIRPKGDTPLYQALIDAKENYKTVTGTNKTIILISDGADSFVGAVPGYPGDNELRKAYAGTGIKIHAIGFRVGQSDFEQLSRIAAITGGQAVQAEGAEELLKQITGVAGLRRFGAYPQGGGEPIPYPLRTLDLRAQPIDLKPGYFDVRVTDSPGREIIDQMKQVRFLRGERHEFLFESGRLRYIFDDRIERAFRQDGVQLTVLESKPEQGGLGIVFALTKKGQIDWRPGAVSVFVSPIGAGEDKLYTAQNLPPNVGGYCVPVWKFFLESWPAEADKARFEIRWTEASTSTEQPYTIRYNDWKNKALAGKLPQGVEITRWEQVERNVKDRVRPALLVRIVFPKDERTIQEWSVTFEDRPIDWARQIYNTEDGIYTGVFVFQNQWSTSDLSLELHRPRARQQGLVFEKEEPVKRRTLN